MYVKNRKLKDIQRKEKLQIENMRLMQIVIGAMIKREGKQKKYMHLSDRNYIGWNK